MVHVLPAHNFKPIPIQLLVCIQKSTLTAALVRIKWRSSEIDNLYKFLTFGKKAITKLNYIYPICTSPSCTI